MDRQPTRTTTEHLAAHRHEWLARFAENVAAQTLGTVTGAGLLYVAAGWFGMLRPPPARVVVVVLLAAALPAAAVVALRGRHALSGAARGGGRAD